MKTETLVLTSSSPGTGRSLTRHVWRGGAGPKVYLQAALHADEMPGAIALWHLMPLLDEAEATGRITGEISVVPFANPIGLSQWLHGKPQGRREMDSMQNFNRGYPDPAALAGDALVGRLTDDPEQNVALIRAEFARALAAQTPQTELEELRLRLMQWSHDADIVLDLHCDHEAVLHFYASSARPDVADLLGRSTGAVLALMEDVSGGNAFDEAHTAPWRALAARFPKHPVPQPTFSTTLEYRGQRDVSDHLAAKDAENLITFLGAVGAITGTTPPSHPPAMARPLAAAGEVRAPQGGIVTWVHTPGATVAAGDTIAWVLDPVTRHRLPVPAPTDGLLFRRELWPFCLKGQSLAHVAGETVIRHGDLLSD